MEAQKSTFCRRTPIVIQRVVSRKSGRVDIKRQAARQIPSSYAQDTSYRSDDRESGTRQKEIRAEHLRKGSTLYYWIRLVEANNFHFWFNPIGGLYKKLQPLE